MRVLWAQGYAAASIDVLCRAMNVPRASLYQMFGDKQGLFAATITHYSDVRFAPVMQHLAGDGDLRLDLAAFLNGVVDFATRDQETLGCLVATALADTAGCNLQLRDRLTRAFDKVEHTLAVRIAKAQAKGQIPTTPTAGDLGVMLAATARGLMVRARTGCSADDLYPAARAAVDLCCRI